MADMHAEMIARVRLLALLAMFDAGGVPTHGQLMHAMGLRARASDALADSLSTMKAQDPATVALQLAARSDNCGIDRRRSHANAHVPLQRVR